MSCGVCGKVRARLPQALRAPLAAFEQRMGHLSGQGARAAVGAPETPRREDDEGDEDEDEVKRP